MNNIKKNIRRTINTAAVVVLLALTIWSCQKAGGDYYDYENPNAAYNGNIIEFLAAQNGIYDSMLYVINKTSLGAELNNGTHTLFAVPNKSFSIAFENLNALRKAQVKAPMSLAQSDSTELDTLIRRYVLPGKIVTDSISHLFDGRWYGSLDDGYEMQLRYERQSANGYIGGGPQQIVFSDPKNSQFERYWVRARTASVNIETSNGIVHILLPSHEFAFGDATVKLNK